MKCVFSKKNCRRGSALIMVLATMTIMMLIGTGLLLISEQNLRNSSDVVQMDTRYYSAESATQWASQLLMSKLQDADLYVAKKDISYDPAESDNSLQYEDDKEDLQNALKAQVASRINAIKDEIADEIGDIEFNGEKSMLESLDIQGDMKFAAEYYDVFKDAVSGEVRHNIIVYLKDPTFVISTKSGTRNATAVLSYSINLGDEETEKREFNFDDYGNGGAFYKSSTGGIYGDANPTEKEEMYDTFIDGLKELIAVTNARDKDSVLNLSPSDVWETVSQNTPAAFAGKPRVRYTGTGTLSGTYPDLEYLDVTASNLTIGTATFPKLKGVYVKGTVAINGSTTVTGSEQYGTSFLIEGNGGENLKITATSTVDWCRFYVKGGSINVSIGGNGQLISNSMFVATKNGYNNAGQIVFGGNNNRMNPSYGKVPQFYAEGDIQINLHNQNVKIRGIYMTLSENVIFKNPGQKLVEGNMQGLFVGNCSSNGSNATKFTSDQEDMMMSGGVYDVLNDVDIGAKPPEVVEALDKDIVANAKPSDMNLYENAGGN